MPTLAELTGTVAVRRDGLPFADSLPAGISLVADGDSGFIEPEVEEVVTASGAVVVLISAPAAVGKTMLARAVAHACQAPLWDLGAFEVGSGTFMGKLVDSHGAQGVGAAVEALGATEYAVVLDALDEGVTLAGWDNLEAFIRDLGRQLLQVEAHGPV